MKLHIFREYPLSETTCVQTQDYTCRKGGGGVGQLQIPWLQW